MESPLIIVTGILYFVAFTTATNENIITSKFTRFVCIDHDKVLLMNLSCSIKPVSRSKTLVNFHGYLTREVNNAVVHVQLFKKYNVYKPFLVDVKENFCNLHLKHPGVPYLKIITNILAPGSNLNHKCPYIGEVYVKDLGMDVSKMLVQWPEGDYRLSIAVANSENSLPFVTVLVYFEVEIKRNWQQKKGTILPDVAANVTARE